MKIPDLQSLLGPLRSFRQVIIILALGLILFLVFNFLVGPQYDSFRGTRLAAKQVEDQLNNINKDLEQIEALEQAIEAADDSDLDKLNRTLPYGENLEELLSNMHKIAQQSGLLIITMYVKPIEALQASEGAVKVSQLNIALRGSYPDFLDFIRSVERHTRLTDVENISIRSITTGSGLSRTETLAINLTASIYHLDSIPSVPLFPYGQNLNTTLFEREQFRALQVLTTILPINTPSQPNPFAP